VNRCWVTARYIRHNIRTVAVAAALLSCIMLQSCAGQTNTEFIAARNDVEPTPGYGRLVVYLHNPVFGSVDVNRYNIAINKYIAGSITGTSSLMIDLPTGAYLVQASNDISKQISGNYNFDLINSITINISTGNVAYAVLTQIPLAPAPTLGPADPSIAFGIVSRHSRSLADISFSKRFSTSRKIATSTSENLAVGTSGYVAFSNGRRVVCKWGNGGAFVTELASCPYGSEFFGYGDAPKNTNLTTAQATNAAPVGEHKAGGVQITPSTELSQTGGTTPSLNQAQAVPRSIGRTVPVLVVPVNLETITQAVDVAGKVQGGGRLVSLSVDGSDATFGSDGSFSFRRAVPVGESEIRLVATDEWGQTSDARIKVVRSIKASGATLASLDPIHVQGRIRPTALALIIGIEKYENAPSADFAENDARSFYDYATNALGIRSERIKLLTGNDARRLDIRKAVLNWAKPLILRGQTDVFVFFSGHGLASEDGNDLFLLPYDGDRSLLADSSIRRKDIIDAITDAGAASATFFLDTCYSGGTRGKDTLVAAARPIMVSAKEQQIPPNVTILAAAGNDQLSSSLEPVKHGLFSYFLMKGLEGNAAGSDHTITAAKLEAYLADHIPSEAAKLGRTQMPQLVGDGSRVISSW